MRKVSVLLPTRGRFKMFAESVNSLYENCDNVDQFELLLALDNDDVDSALVQEYSSTKNNIKILYFDREYYKGLHIYYNKLFDISLGTSIFSWNDDTLMLSKGWDTEILKAHDEGFFLLSPKVENMEEYWLKTGALYPIIPRKWVEITGKYSAVPSCDSWLDWLAKRLGIDKRLESVVLFHDRYELTGNNCDATYLEGTKAGQGYSYPPQPDIWKEHFEKLAEYIGVPTSQWKLPWEK